MLQNVKKNLEPSSEHYLTSIVALGHLAYNLPNQFPFHIKNIISRKIVRELLVVDSSECRYDPSEEAWCCEAELDLTTRCKLEGMKTMSRWLLGLKEDVVSAQKTFRMLNAFISSGGDLNGSNKLSKPEMSWLRLRAGCVMLRISEQKGVGDQFNIEQFYELSRLMIDEVPQVREAFATKLHKGLCQPLPGRCLPLDFMGIYVLAGLEQDKKIKAYIKKMMVIDINKRREYAKTLTTSSTGSKVNKAMSQLPAILPDYMLTFAIPVLVHLPTFTDPSNVEQLKLMRSCLW
jgi:sister-chromatid-cohesion protein PDS5